MDYVLQLAEAGLTEMRALIFELRPESLETEGLVVALEKQVAATRARYGLTVDAEFCAEPDIPIELKEAAYRIAQEALHNVVKHARASHVHVRMRKDAEELLLAVTDDGAGFDTGGSFPGHIGLRSMRERVARAGGTLEITSAPGKGTSVAAHIPLGAA
jgi:signal transduction histidine kinase